MLPLMVRYVQLRKFAEMAGYTEATIRGKIQRGEWRQGHEYRRAPDGGLLIDLEGYDTWVQRQ